MGPYFTADHGACSSSSGHSSDADLGCLHLDPNNRADLFR